MEVYVFVDMRFCKTYVFETKTSLINFLKKAVIIRVYNIPNKEIRDFIRGETDCVVDGKFISNGTSYHISKANYY